MTPQERILLALDGRLPDRTPVVPKIWVDSASLIIGRDILDTAMDPRAAMRTIIEAGIDCGLDGVRLFHFPRRSIVRRGERAFETADDGREIGEIDVRGGLATHLHDAADFDLRDPRRMACHHFWTAGKPFLDSMEEADSIAVPGRADLDGMGWTALQRGLMEEFGGRIAFLGDCSSGTLAFLVTLRGMERALFDLMERPDLVHRTMEKGVAIAAAKARFHADLGVRVLRLNDSVANMSVISPAHWREYIFPHMRDFCSEIHSYAPGIRIYCHICGNSLPIVDGLQEAGIDCIGPMDPLGGAAPAEFRRKAGPGFPLMGGVHTLSFCNGTPESVRREALSCIRQAGGDGAFLLGSGCALPRQSRRDNIRALREASEEYGRGMDGPSEAL
jgi:uroporphyrinogen-III decarboxylase